jgi:hypothetical protein
MIMQLLEICGSLPVDEGWWFLLTYKVNIAVVF